MNENDSNDLFDKYRKGELLSGEIKKMLIDKLLKLNAGFQNNLKKITKKELEKSVLTNKTKLNELFSKAK